MSITLSPSRQLANSWHILGVVIAIAWIFAGRLMPWGLSLLLSVSQLDPGGRVVGIGLPDYALLAEARFGARLGDQLFLAAGVGGLLCFAFPWVGPWLRQSRWLRWPLLALSLIVLSMSELLLIPAIANAGTWSGLPLVTQLLAETWQRSSAVTGYLFYKALAWLIVVAIAWPGARAKLPSAARWTALGAWWITVWQTGQLMSDFGGHTDAVDWRPWGIAHLASTLGDFPLMAGMGLLSGLLVLPGVLLVMRHLKGWTAVDEEAIENAVPESLGSPWLPVAFTIVVGMLLVQPLWWALQAGASSVAYPDLNNLRYWAKQPKWNNYGAIFNPPFSNAALWGPLLLTVGRALGEVAIAYWAAQGFARWSGYARGVPAFLALLGALIGPIGAAAGIAYSATLQQTGIWPWPPSSTTLPWLIVAFLALQGAWPERMKAAPVDEPRPINLRWRLAAWVVAFIALYLAQEPLLLPPSPNEAILWPTVAVTKVLAEVDPLFPKRIAWLVGWHLPLVIASIGLASLLLPGTPGPATISADE